MRNFHRSPKLYARPASLLWSFEKRELPRQAFLHHRVQKAVQMHAATLRKI